MWNTVVAALFVGAVAGIAHGSEPVAIYDQVLAAFLLGRGLRAVNVDGPEPE
jgi:hypothetical protein